MSELYEQALEAFRSGDNERARELSERLADRADSRERIDGLCMLARVALRDGDLDRVRALAGKAREEARALGDLDAERMPLHLQAAAARMAAETGEARRLYGESIELNRRLGKDFVAGELHNLAYVELHDGNLDRAKELFRQSLGLARDRGLQSLLPYLVIDSGVVAAEEGELERAARLLAASEAAFEASGTVLDPDDRVEFDRALEKARAGLEPSTFAAAWEEGRGLSVENALA